jgi:hypothetical protein
VLGVCGARVLGKSISGTGPWGMPLPDGCMLGPKAMV